VREKERENEPRQIIPSGFNAQDWRKVDLKQEAFKPNADFEGAKFLSFKPRHATYLSIFLSFLPLELLHSIWEINNWLYESDKKAVFGGDFDICNIYKFIAIKIRVQGIHVTPQHNQLNPKILEKKMQEASAYFQDTFPGYPRPPGRNLLTILNSRFLIDYRFFDQISLSFQSIVSELGEYVSGDEKLDHFTGLSGVTRYVLTKPARVGLWH